MTVSCLFINLFRKKFFNKRGLKRRPREANVFHVLPFASARGLKRRPREANVFHVLPFASGSTVDFLTDYINGTNIHSLTNTAILSPRNNGCTDNKWPYREYFYRRRLQEVLYCIDDEDKSGEQPYPIEFLKRLSLSCLPQRTLNLKFNTIVIFFILQQLKTLQHYKFPIKIAFAKGQTLKLLEYIDHCLFFPPWPTLCGIFSSLFIWT